MKPKDKAKYLIEALGEDGAIRQCLEEIGNADTERDRDFWCSIKRIIQSKDQPI